MLALWVIIATAILASISIFLLLKSSLTNPKKQKILMIVGVLIFISIVISNFKSRQILSSFNSLLSLAKKDKQTQRIAQLYEGTINIYSKQQSISQQHRSQYPNVYVTKYHNIGESDIGEQLFIQNYGQVSIKQYNQKILYNSQPKEGASYFMQQLASKLRYQGIPALYVKLQFGGKQFLRKTGFTSYNKFKDSLTYYIQKQKQPYILIDNAQKLPCQIWKLLLTTQYKNQINIILNTEHISKLIQKIQQIASPQSDEQHSSIQQFLLEFQYRYWIGPSKNILLSLSPSNSYMHQQNIYNKNGHINFQRLSQMKEGITQEQIILKMSNAHNTVAQYYGLQSSFSKVKRLIESKGLNIIKNPKQMGSSRSTEINKSIEAGVLYSNVRKAGISLDQLQKLQQIGLIQINNGIVYLN